MRVRRRRRRVDRVSGGCCFAVACSAPFVGPVEVVAHANGRRGDCELRRRRRRPKINSLPRQLAGELRRPHLHSINVARTFLRRRPRLAVSRRREQIAPRRTERGASSCACVLCRCSPADSNSSGRPATSQQFQVTASRASGRRTVLIWRAISDSSIVSGECPAREIRLRPPLQTATARSRALKLASSSSSGGARSIFRMARRAAHVDAHRPPPFAPSPLRLDCATRAACLPQRRPAPQRRRNENMNSNETEPLSRSALARSNWQVFAPSQRRRCSAYSRDESILHIRRSPPFAAPRHVGPANARRRDTRERERRAR